MNARLLACMALTLLLAAPAQAAMYKWVDKDGSVVYSEMPPSDASKAQTIAPPPPPPAEAPGDPAGDPAGKEPSAISDRNEEARRQFEETRRKNCEIAKENLQTYRTAARVLTADKKTVELDTGTRAARIEQAEQDIATYCK